MAKCDGPRFDFVCRLSCRPHYRLSSPPAKRVKRPQPEKTWDHFPFASDDGDWFEACPPPSPDKKTFFSTTRVRLKPVTSLFGVVHKTFPAESEMDAVDTSPPTLREESGSSPEREGRENGDGLCVPSAAKGASPAPCSAAALIASVQGAAVERSDIRATQGEEDMVFDVSSTKPDASVLQLNFPLVGDASESNGPAAIVNFNATESVVNGQLSKEGSLRPNGNSLSSLRNRQQSWSVVGQSTENGIPSPAL